LWGVHISLGVLDDRKLNMNQHWNYVTGSRISLNVQAQTKLWSLHRFGCEIAGATTGTASFPEVEQSRQ
jgi:hypothetical protein